MINWLRRLPRSGRSHLLIGALGFAFGVYMAFIAAGADRRLAQHVAYHQVANYGLWYSLTQEQAKAGRFEAQRNDLQNTVDALRKRLSKQGIKAARLQERIDQKQQRIEQLESGQWTGQVRTKSRKQE